MTVRERKGDWLVTYTGQRFYPLDPRASEMRIVDVAHHLAMIPRFGGAVKDHYSVAEHCVLGSYVVPPEDALEFLLHDAAEAWIGDWIRPVKHHTEAGRLFVEIEAGIDKVVREKWYLPEVMSSSVATVDNAMCDMEMTEVFQSYPGVLDGSALPGVHVQFWPWQKAEARFLARFAELSNPVRNPLQRSRWWDNLFQGRTVTA